MDVATLAMTFPPCLSRKGLSLELDNHEISMDWAYVCTAFSPSLSRESRHGVGSTCAAHGLARPYRARTITWDNAKKNPSPRQARRKGKCVSPEMLVIDLSPLPVEKNAVS